MSSYPVFDVVADQITDKKGFHDIIARQQRFFQINPYKIEKFYPETAKKIYAQISINYQVTKELKVSENAWQQNQRRVFVWYIIVLFDLHLVNVQKRSQIKWDQLSAIFFNKNPQFLEFQFFNILKSKNKITWNQDEDKTLLQAISKQKPGKWNQVSKRIFYQSECEVFKSPKHCRQRWYNHLDQSKSKGSWTLQEDYAIFKFIHENGKRWASIVKQLKNSRTEHMIKNRYNSHISKLKKNKKRREEQIAQVVYRQLETEIKNQRRAKKMRNQGLISNSKKAQTFQLQNLLQQNIQKSQNSEEQKCQHSTQKNPEAKIEQEIKDQEIKSAENSQLPNAIQEPYLYSNILQNMSPFWNEYMQMNPFQYYFLCTPPAFVPATPYYSLNQMRQ